MLPGYFFRGFLDECEEARGTLLAVDDERAAEDLVTAMLRVDPAKPKISESVSGRPFCFSILWRYCISCRTQREALLLVACPMSSTCLMGSGSWLTVKIVLMSGPVVHTLEHGIVLGVLVFDGEVLLNTRNASRVHTFNVNGICAPWCNHFAAWSDEEAVQLLVAEHLGVAVEPAQFLLLLLTGLVVHLSGNDSLLRSLKEKNHSLSKVLYERCVILQVQRYKKLSINHSCRQCFYKR